MKDIILYKLVYEYESSSPKPLDEILFTSLFFGPKNQFFWPNLAWFGPKVDTSKKLSHLTYISNSKALAAKLWPVDCSQAHPDADADGYTQVHTEKKLGAASMVYTSKFVSVCTWVYPSASALALASGWACEQSTGHNFAARAL